MKNKIKIFIALGISLITTCIFMINTFAQVGYTINNNGTIESLNIWNENWRNGYYDTSNGNYVYNSDYVCTADYITINPNTTYSISIVNNMDFQFYNSNKTFLYNVSKYIRDGNTYTFTTGQYTYYMTFYITDLYGSTYNKDIMLNKGTTLLDYFPYGNYTNKGNNGQIYEQLNGTKAKLFQTNITNINTALNTQGIIEEQININNQTSYSWNSSSIPTIENCIINYNPAINLSNRATVLLELKNATIFDNLTFTRIDKNQDRYIYLYNENKKLITTLTITRKVETIIHII